MLDCLSFDPFSLFDDGVGSAEVGISRCDVVQALVITLVVVMLDERFDLVFQIAWSEVVLEQHAVLECLVPHLFLALDLTLCLWMERRTAHMACLPTLQARLPDTGHTSDRTYGAG